jgi:prepilin-type N-terminal cleavage/methylation domain-containing protein
MRSHYLRHRRGFSLVELLVVIAVIGILMGLVLPAVQAAREASRRAQCINNLKQIGLAIQHYNESNRVFPPVALPTFTGSQGQFGSGHYHSPLARVLPYIEQKNLYDAINFGPVPSSGNAVFENLTAMKTSVAAFLCPSDGERSVEGFGRCNYRFNLGATHRFGPDDVEPSSWFGPFSAHRVYGAADFTDGLSQTIGVSERLQGDWAKSAIRRLGDYRLTTADGYTLIGPDAATEVCRALAAGTPLESRGGESWFLSGFHFTSYNHCTTPNSDVWACSFDPHTDDLHSRVKHDGVFPATSYHSGGVHALRMDGSVRFEKDSVSLVVWRGLGTRSGGEITGSD